MATDDSTISNDGAKSFFEQEEADVPDVGTRERFMRQIDLMLFAPLRVAWTDWRARIGIGIIVFFILLGTVVTQFYPEAQLNEVPQYTTWFQTMDAPLGSDHMGRRIDSQIVHATPNILKMGAAAVIFSVGVAVAVGCVAGYKGGTVDYVLMTLTDIVMIIPGLPFTILLIAIYTPSDPFWIGVVLAIDSWPGLARALRSQVLTIREESYVEASRAMGVSTPAIVRRDITPQLMPYIMINAANAARGVVFAAVGLYFLGFLPEGDNNWGVIMNTAYDTGSAMSNLGRAGHWLFAPMIVLAIFSFGLILFSQGMDRVFNTKIRARHARTVEEDEGEQLPE